MSKFKFGDYVHHKIHGFGVVASHVKEDCAHVRFESMEEKHIGVKDLKLVPHPDTVQLNALKDKISKLSDVSFTCNLCGEDNEISTEIQDIIDFAITEEQADD